MVLRLPVNRPRDFIVEMLRIPRDEIGQVDIFRMVPDRLHRIEFGCVRRKPLDT